MYVLPRACRMARRAVSVCACKLYRVADGGRSTRGRGARVQYTCVRGSTYLGRAATGRCVWGLRYLWSVALSVFAAGRKGRQPGEERPGGRSCWA